jgi:hypothetical protein
MCGTGDLGGLPLLKEAVDDGQDREDNENNTESVHDRASRSECDG